MNDGARKILIADDDENIVMTLKSILELNGYRVVTASDGEETLAKLKSENPDLLILDLNMPHMDGASVTHDLKMRRTPAPIPIIVISGMIAGDMAKNISYENIAYLSKPFEINHLLDRLQIMLGSA